jgi:uncharacterized protein (DUF58 family)
VTVNVEELINLRYVATRVVLTNRRRISTVNAGGYLSAVRGRGMDFDETRGYQAGDDIRFMDWRVMARTGKAHTKLFHEEKERPVFLVVDQSARMHFGTRVTFKSTIAAHTAAILAWAAVQQGDRIGGVIFNDHDFCAIKPRSRKHGVLHIFNQLVAMNQQPQGTATVGNQLEQVLMQLRRVCHPGGLIFIISDFATMTPAIERHLRALGRHNEIIACQVYDQLERDPPPANIYQFTDGTRRVWLDSRKKDMHARYKHQFETQQEALKSLLTRQRIPLLELGTHESIADVLLSLGQYN